MTKTLFIPIFSFGLLLVLWPTSTLAEITESTIDFSNHGQRVVQGCGLLAYTSHDDFLEFTRSHNNNTDNNNNNTDNNNNNTDNIDNNTDNIDNNTDDFNYDQIELPSMMMQCYACCLIEATGMSRFNLVKKPEEIPMFKTVADAIVDEVEREAMRAHLQKCYEKARDTPEPKDQICAKGYYNFNCLRRYPDLFMFEV